MTQLTTRQVQVSANDVDQINQALGLLCQWLDELGSVTVAIPPGLNLAAWITGTPSRVIVGDNGNGTVTLTTPAFQERAEKGTANGYAGLNAATRLTNGLDTVDHVIVDDAAKGIVLKDTQGTPHYWQVGVSVLGVLTTTDLGTVLP